MTRAEQTALAVVELRTGEAQCYEPIVLTVADGPDVRCLTEPMLDTWWANLTPAAKADLYERDLDGDPLVELLAATLLRGSLADAVAMIDAAGSSELGVLLRGQSKLHAAALVPDRERELVPVGQGLEGVPAHGHLFHTGGVVEGTREQGAAVLAQGHAPLGKEHLETHGDAVRELSLKARAEFPFLGSFHVSHAQQCRRTQGENPVEVLHG